MTFFNAQKKIIYLWFVWGCFLMLFIGINLLRHNYTYVLKELIVWLSKYLIAIFTLITGSTFFSKSYFKEALKDKIYFRLAYIASFLYLSYITIILIIVPIQAGFTMTDEGFIAMLDSHALFLTILLPIVTALLSYFFYKNKKDNAPAEEKVEA